MAMLVITRGYHGYNGDDDPILLLYFWFGA